MATEAKKAVAAAVVVQGERVLLVRRRVAVGTWFIRGGGRGRMLPDGGGPEISAKSPAIAGNFR